MITILSPAKTIDMNKINWKIEHTEPYFANKAAELMDKLKELSPLDLEELMKINPKLAEENFVRIASWEKEFSQDKSRHAVFAYDGAVYRGLNAQELKKSQLSFAQEHLRILTGLYGALRPLDALRPHRLEMGTKLRIGNCRNLYEFWKDSLTDYFASELEKQKEKVIVNLASKEYYSAIDFEKLNCKIVTPIFKEYKSSKLKMITIYAKRARGLMARFIIENKIDSVKKLEKFDTEGYRLRQYSSDSGEMLFTR